MSVGVSVFGIRRGGAGAGRTTLKRASRLARRNPALPIAPHGKPGSGLGAQRTMNECVGEARVPLRSEHVALHYELARAQEAGYVGRAQQVGVARGEEQRHEAFEEAWEAEDGADEGAASVDGLTGAQ